MSCCICTAAHRLPPSGCTSRLRSRCLGNHRARVLVAPPNDLITRGEVVYQASYDGAATAAEHDRVAGDRG
jgi:hypothetical protein